MSAKTDIELTRERLYNAVETFNSVGKIPACEEYENSGVCDCDGYHTVEQYLDDALSVTPLVHKFTNELEELTVLIAFGGPNIELDARRNVMRIGWGGKADSAPVNAGLCDQIWDMYDY